MKKLWPILKAAVWLTSYPMTRKKIEVITLIILILGILAAGIHGLIALWKIAGG